jgi:hypothetical protein
MSYVDEEATHIGKHWLISMFGFEKPKNHWGF